MNFNKTRTARLGKRFVHEIENNKAGRGGFFMGILQAAVVAFTITNRLLRQCPHCHHKQVVALSEASVTVACGRCGADVLPKR